MAAFCAHESCLGKELEFLSDMERTIWEHARGDTAHYLALSRKFQRWVTNQRT